MPSVTIDLEDALYERLKQQAADRGLTVEAYIADIVRCWLDAEEARRKDIECKP